MLKELPHRSARKTARHPAPQRMAPYRRGSARWELIDTRSRIEQDSFRFAHLATVYNGIARATCQLDGVSSLGARFRFRIWGLASMARAVRVRSIAGTKDEYYDCCETLGASQA